MILVAGIGNVLLGDEGFGVEVARRPQQKPPANTRVIDFGVRGLDLAYCLLEAWDAAILVDAAARGGTPGTLYVLEPHVGDAAAQLEMHSVDPMRVLKTVKAMGGVLGPVRVV